MRNFEDWIVNASSQTRLSNKDLLREGLIKTYPLSFFFRKINRLLGNSSIKFQIFKDELLNVLQLNIEYEGLRLINTIENTSNVSGYFIAQILVNNIPNKDISFESIIKTTSKDDVISILFESKFDKLFTDLPEEIYHVTLKQNLPKIQKSGLIPKFKWKLSFHLDRVYFTLSHDIAKTLIKEFSEVLQIEESKYIILKAKTNGLKNIKFYNDPNAILYDGETIGIYTHENISSDKLEEC
jgi:hypothetical protein